MLRVTKWIATFVGGLIRFLKENNALPARNVVASLNSFKQLMLRRRGESLRSHCWVISGWRQINYYTIKMDTVSQATLQKDRRHWEMGSDRRRTKGANKENIKVCMSRCFGVNNNMQQKTACFACIKIPKYMLTMILTMETNTITYRKMNTENGLRCIWLLIWWWLDMKGE